ncbi:rCG56238 [Rattus norvegicus]|uniref:RCG56238 n=1 Tax=Rattus norvegicus TaxID=10116 RepID=A6IAE7_RAT|nr:rCG56238 [Rattus norvegicus]
MTPPGSCFRESRLNLVPRDSEVFLPRIIKAVPFCTILHHPVPS